MTKENVARALLRLSQIEEYKSIIGRSGSIPLLINLLENGTIRGKKDAATALYALCSLKENKIRAVQGGIMRPLVELMADLGSNSNIVDKALVVVSLLISLKEGKDCLVDEGGIPVVVEIVEVGTQRQKEIGVSILLCLCEESVAYRSLVGREQGQPRKMKMKRRRDKE